MLSLEFCKIFKNTFLIECTQATVSVTVLFIIQFLVDKRENAEFHFLQI